MARSKQESLALVNDWMSSSQPRTKWCSDHGLSTKTLSNLLYIYKVDLSKENIPTGWVKVNAKSSKKKIQPVITGGIEICVGKYIVKVADNFNRAAFSIVCEELNNLC
jgi:hypothetical protein